MTGNYAYTPHIWPLLLTVIFLMFLAIHSWRRRNVPGARPFMAGCLLTIFATTGLFMTYLAVDPGTKIFWFRFMSSWLLPATTAVTCFILEYAWPGRWLNLRNLILLSIMPLFFISYFLGGGGYVLLGSIDFMVSETVMPLFDQFGWLFAIYSLILTFVNLIVFAWLFIRSPQHRWPVVLMAASQIAMRIILLGDGPSLVAQVFNIPVFALPYLAYAIALFGFRIFDPIPLARQKAIDQLYAGMIVLDPQQRVVSLNPAAEQILGANDSQARGQPVREWLPACPEGFLENPGGTEIEFSLGSGPELRYYTLAISLLKDFRGLAVGHLLLLHNVTKQKQAQAQILEQQRLLAVQNEREHMARELHDSLGQVLSYTGFQVETAAKLFYTGQGEDAVMQLNRLGSVVREAHADLREVILNLHSTASLQQPFFTTLDQYLDGFTGSYDIQTHLKVDPRLGDHPFSPEAQLQVFRILQEALSNARKHGHARQVQVVFAPEDGQVRMSIQDDGCGFVPDKALMASGSHYGLHFMQARARQLEGSLQVQSSPGAGTQVVLEVPLMRDTETREERDTETRRSGERERR